LNQRRYLDAIESHDMVFGHRSRGNREDLSRSGHGNFALISKSALNRIILARPAVEAGDGWGPTRNVAGEN